MSKISSSTSAAKSTRQETSRPQGGDKAQKAEKAGTGSTSSSTTTTRATGTGATVSHIAPRATTTHTQVGDRFDRTAGSTQTRQAQALGTTVSTAAQGIRLSQPGTTPTQVQALNATNNRSNLPPLTEAEKRAAEQALIQADGSRNAAPLADFLRQEPNPAKRSAYMAHLYNTLPEVTAQALNNSQNLPAQDQRVLANSLNGAFRSGALTREQFQQGVVAYGAGAGPGETHEGLANIVAKTGNPELINSYVERELQLINQQPHGESQRAVAVATALKGLPPQELQNYLANNQQTVNDVLNLVHSHPDGRHTGAIGGLLDAARRIYPPTNESIGLFNQVVPMIDDNVQTRSAAARFFTSHTDAVLNHPSNRDSAGSLSLEGQKRMSEFFARTLFTEPPFEGQEHFRGHVNRTLQSMEQSLARYANTNPPPLEAQRAARLMGSLVGSVEGGFHVAAKELEQRNQSVEGMVDMIFRLKDLIPTARLPGAGIIQDLTIDQIQNWVTDNLKEQPQNASESLPFHVLFGERIANPELRDDYDTARATAFVNRETGL